MVEARNLSTMMRKLRETRPGLGFCAIFKDGPLEQIEAFREHFDGNIFIDDDTAFYKALQSKSSAAPILAVLKPSFRALYLNAPKKVKLDSTVEGIGGVVVVGPGDRGVMFCDEDVTESPALRKKFLAAVDELPTPPRRRSMRTHDSVLSVFRRLFSRQIFVS